MLDDLPRGLKLLVGVGPSQVEVELIEGSFGQEVGAAGEGFEIEEFILDEAVDGFDIGLVGVSGGRDAEVLTIAESRREAFSAGTAALPTDELAAVVGLPDQVAQADAEAFEVALDASGEDLAGGSAAGLGEGQKEQATADLAGRVLHDGQMEGLGLGPVGGNFIEVLGVGGDLLEEPPSGLNGGQVLLALIFTTAFFDQAVPVPDAFQGAMGKGQVELADQAARAEGGEFLAQGDHLLLDSTGCLLRLVMRRAGDLPQTVQTLLGEAPQPFAHGRHGGREIAGGPLDAVLAGILHQPQAMVIAIGHITNQVKVPDGRWHSPPIVKRFGGGLALPPASPPSLSTASGSHTSTPQGGYDVGRLYQGGFELAL